MSSPINPPALQPGDTIALINENFPAVLSRARSLFEDRGYKVRIFFTKDTGVKSSLLNRHAEIRSAFLDEEIAAIICTIGGITFTEMLPLLISDNKLQDHIRLHPKIVVGSSDMTGLHWFLNVMTGLRTFYGPSAISELGIVDVPCDGISPLTFCVSNLLNATTNPKPLGDIPRSAIYSPQAPPFFRNPASVEVQAVVPAPAWKWLRGGKAQGRLFGGCLGVMARLNGILPIRPDWRGRIIFVETSSEESKDLPLAQRALADLIAQGIFEKAAGLVIGRPIGYDSEEKLNEYAGVFKELLCEDRFASGENQFPILMNVDFGHTMPMVTLPYNVLAEIDAEYDRFTILESGVAP